jgi:hypothetical protein
MFTTTLAEPPLLLNSNALALRTRAHALLLLLLPLLARLG